ncbi:MAG: ATP-binding protein [Eubacteriales bacterium]
MRELSLHIMDILQNSIKAKATLIKVVIKEELEKDVLMIKVIDNGVGIESGRVQVVKNPFHTSRTTRRVGLGLSLFEAAANRCEGNLKIWSKVNIGTIITAVFKHSHIDRAPIGNMSDSIISVILSMDADTDLVYKHFYNDRLFTIDTRQIRDIIGLDISLQRLEVLNWIKEYINEGLMNIMEV